MISWESAVNRICHQSGNVFSALLRTDESGHSQLDIQKKSYPCRDGYFTPVILKLTTPQLHFCGEVKSHA